MLHNKIKVVIKEIKNYFSLLHKVRHERKERIFTCDSICGLNTYMLGTGFNFLATGERPEAAIMTTLKWPKEDHAPTSSKKLPWCKTQHKHV